MPTRIILAMVSAALALPLAAASPIDTLPAWLAGSWCTAEGPQGRTCERWGPPAGGMMLGVSQMVKGGRTVSFEFVRIVEGVNPHGPTATYIAQPGGGAPVSFLDVPERAGQEIVFLNPGHDYPQRIRYARDGDVLMAEISLADGSKPMRWRYARVAE